MSKFERSQDLPAFYQDADHRWRTNQQVIIEGDVYNKGAYIPHVHAADYRRSNRSVTYWSKVRRLADHQQVSVSVAREKLSYLADTYRAISIYSHIWQDKDGRLRDRKGRFVRITAEVRRLRDRGLFQYKDKDDRYKKYIDVKFDVTGSP